MTCSRSLSTALSPSPQRLRPFLHRQPRAGTAIRSQAPPNGTTWCWRKYGRTTSKPCGENRKFSRIVLGEQKKRRKSPWLRKIVQCLQEMLHWTIFLTSAVLTFQWGWLAWNPYKQEIPHGDLGDSGYLCLFTECPNARKWYWTGINWLCPKYISLFGLKSK